MSEFSKKLTIKDWDDQDKPREKLLTKGPDSLSDSEILAILISTGTANKSAIEVAKDLLSFANNDIDKLANLEIKELQKTHGIGEAKAITIMAALELGKRRMSATNNKRRIQIKSSTDIFNFIGPQLFNLRAEEFWVIYLNNGNFITETQQIGKGSQERVVVDIKKIIKYALLNNASKIIIVHNHPSGILEPSPEDHKITQAINKACDAVTLKLLDHIIIGNSLQHNAYYSFNDEGYI
jgi:DNA repair protein RadC